MLRRMLLGSIFLASPLFAESSSTECKAAEAALQVLEEAFIPKDKDSCTTFDDCSFYMKNLWTPAVGINLKTRKAYEKLYRNKAFKRYSSRAEEFCQYERPETTQAIPDEEDDTECIENRCVIRIKRL